MNAAAPPLLSIEALTVDLPAAGGGRARVLSEIDLQVHRGETLGIVGESGSGKSMTALAVMGLLPPRARVAGGRVVFDGLELTALPERRVARLRGDRLAMIFQDPMTALNPLMTVGAQLCEGFLRHRKGSRRQVIERAVRLLERVGLREPARCLGQHPHELSGGQRQRVLIAMALMCEPALVVADEPTTALDVGVQAQVLALLRELQAELNLALVLVTHDIGVVARVADRVAVMYAGRVVETGPADAVLRDARHPYTAGLLACLPRRGAAGRGRPLGTIPGTMPAPAEPTPGCRFADRCGFAVDRCRGPDGARLHRFAHGRDCRCVRAGPAPAERSGAAA